MAIQVKLKFSCQRLRINWWTETIKESVEGEGSRTQYLDNKVPTISSGAFLNFPFKDCKCLENPVQWNKFLSSYQF